MNKPEFHRPLASYAGARPPQPDWYRALDIEPQQIVFPMVEGARIEVLIWGEAGRPGVLLAHGSRAHARWWGPVAPLLAQDYRVASLSWSGMGGSDWRETYELDTLVAELFVAADCADLFGGKQPPVFVAHSFGTRAMTRAAATRGGEISGAILVDGVLSSGRAPPADFGANNRRYASLEDALARFTLKPDQPCDNAFILDDIARAGAERVADGWRWRFDPDYYRKFVRTDVWDDLSQPKCPLAMIYGKQSAVLTEEELAAERAQAPTGTPFIGIAEAAHHVMADQPFALTAAIQALVETWLGAAREGA